MAAVSPLTVVPLAAGLNDHPRLARDETRALMREPIHRDATLVADPHPADRRARLAAHRCAEGAMPRIEERDGERCALAHEEPLSIDENLHAARHALTSPRRRTARA